MARMTGPDCAVMCNLINTYIYKYTHTYLIPPGSAEELVPRPDPKDGTNCEISVDDGRSIQRIESHRVQPARGVFRSEQRNRITPPLRLESLFYIIAPRDKKK